MDDADSRLRRLQLIHKSLCLQPGSWLARTQWGQGFATEAGAALVAYAFGTLGVRRIHAGLHRDNVRSRRVVEKLGFAFLGPDPNPGSPALEFALDNPARGAA